MLMHLCLRLPLDDAMCMCVSGSTAVLAAISFVFVAWWVGR